MNAITQNEKIKITEFCQKFADSAAHVLQERLDKDVYEKISINVTDIDVSKNMSEYKKDNVVYVTDYAKEDKQGKLAMLLPEEFIADVADVMMGGNGETPYEGKLTELQMNSANDLIKKILKKIETIFKESYNKNIAFSADSNAYTKENSDYEEKINELTDLNFLITEEIKLNETKSYKYKVALNFASVEDLMISLNIFDKKGNSKILSDAIGLNQLKDVRIDITAELGHREVPIKYAMELVKGSIVELDTVINQDIVVYANGIEVAKAQIVAVEDNFGLKITKILSPEERMRSL